MALVHLCCLVLVLLWLVTLPVGLVWPLFSARPAPAMACLPRMAACCFAAGMDTCSASGGAHRQPSRSALGEAAELARPAARCRLASIPCLSACHKMTNSQGEDPRTSDVRRTWPVQAVYQTARGGDPSTPRGLGPSTSSPLRPCLGTGGGLPCPSGYFRPCFVDAPPSPSRVAAAAGARPALGWRPRAFSCRGRYDLHYATRRLTIFCLCTVALHASRACWGVPTCWLWVPHAHGALQR